MAEDSPELAALKDQLAREQTRRDIAAVQLAVAQSTQQIKASAQATADAAAKARFGSVTGSSQSGDVTLGTGAGNAEASLLAARAVQEAATRIAQAVLARIETDAPPRKMLVFAKQQPIIVHWRWFRMQLDMVTDAFRVAAEFAAEAESVAQAPPPVPLAAMPMIAPSPVASAPAPVQPASGDAPRPVAGAPPAAGFIVPPGALLTGASAALDAASKLGSYLQTSYQVAANTIAGSDDLSLAQCVAGHLPDALFPGAWTPTGGISELTALLEPLALTRYRATGRQKMLKTFSQANSVSVGGTAASVNEQQHRKDVCDRCDRATDAFDVAFKSFDDLIKSLAQDSGGVPLAALVCDEKWSAAQLEAGALALLVRLNMSAGANYTKKSIWSFLLGGMPFYVMGSAVADYILLDGQSGVVRAAGQFPIHGGYYRVDEVVSEFGAKSARERLPWWFRWAI